MTFMRASVKLIEFVRCGAGVVDMITVVHGQLSVLLY